MQEQEQVQTKQFEDLLDLYSKEGWKVLIQGITERVEMLKNSLTDVTGLQETGRLQGEIRGLVSILTMKDATNSAYESYKESKESEPVIELE